LFVLPSHNENFANVVIEALSAGTPVMVSNMVGLHQYVADKKLGWVCSTSVEDISEKLRLIFSEKTKLEKMSQLAKATVGEDFSSEKLTNKYIAQYQKLINRKK
jgi:glycosyltransferase involved in cell wall biosynthesis